MSHKVSNKKVFIVENSAESFATWINKPFIPEKLRRQLSKANILIVPREGYREEPSPVFPVGTEELLDYLREYSRKGIVPDICINDKDYKELSLHSALIIIGSLVITSIVGPIIADLISEYIKKRWMTKVDKAQIKLELTIVKNDGSASYLLYEGPANEFLSTVKPTLRSLAEKNNKQAELPNTELTKEM